MVHHHSIDGPDDQLPLPGQDDEQLGRLIRDACFTHLSREEHHECRKAVQNFAIGNIPVREEVDLRLQEHMHLPAESLPGDHLRPEEQAEAKLCLTQFMQAHPHRSFRAEPAVPMLDRFFENLAFLTRGNVFRGIAAFCVVLVLGNSVAFAASETVPGDTLYPVKINVLEPARAMVTVTAAGRAEWASNCVKRRLAETERLIARKELTPAHWATIEESLDRHVTVAKRHINRLAKEDPESAADLSVNLETTLVAHSTALSDVQEDDRDEVLSSVFMDVSSAASVAAQFTIDIEGQVSSADEDMERIAARTIRAASSAVSDLDASTQSDTVEPNARHAKEARSLLDDADIQLKAGKFKQSMDMARQAVRKAEAGKVFLRMGLTVDTDADTSISSSSFESFGASSVQAVSASSTSCSSSVYFLSSQPVVVPVAGDSPSSKEAAHTSASSMRSTSSSSSSMSSLAERKSVSSQESSASVEARASAGVSLSLVIPSLDTLPTLPSLP